MEQGKSQVQGKEKTTKTLEKRPQIASSQRSADSNRELRFVFSVAPPAAIASRIFYGISDVTRITFGVSGCALGMGINALIGSLAMHHFDYRGEVWGLRFSSALKGLIYLKVRL